MRVACIVSSFVPYAIHLANALSASNPVSFISTVEQVGRLQELLDPAVAVHTFPYRRVRDPRGLAQVVHLLSAVKSIRPDVIHLQQTGDPRLSLAFWLLRGYPTVLTVHDVVWQHGAPAHPREFLKDLPLKTAGEVIVHGEALRELYLRLHPNTEPDRVHVIPLGVYTLFQKWAQPGIAEKPFTLLFFGRMQPYKGLATLVEAARLLAGRLPGARIVIAGQGPELDRRMEDLNRLPNVLVYNHYIPDDQAARLFQEACVIALPYEEASQSAVVAMAYAFGKPVVATNVGALSEAVEDGKTGFIVPAGNPRLFAQAVIHLLQNDILRAQMGENILRKAQNELAWETIADQTMKVYEKAIETRNHACRPRQRLSFR